MQSDRSSDQPLDSLRIKNSTPLRRRALLWTAAAASALLLAACDSGDDGFTGNVKSVAVFGDSLSDLGTYQVGPVAAAGGGRFTTNPGKVWVEHVAEYYGTTVARNRTGGYGSPPAVSGGTGYAEGGARVAEQPGIGCNTDGAGGCLLTGALTRPVTQQVTAHLAANGGRVPSGQLVLVLAGANDMFFQAGRVSAGASTVAQAQAAMAGVGTALSNEIKKLTAAGANRVVVLSAFDIARTPLTNALVADPAARVQQQSLFVALALAFNNALSGGLAGAAGVTYVASSDFQIEVAANPARYGFVNTTLPACNIAVLPGNSSLFCSPATLSAPNANANFLYADAVHPTVGAHKQFADFVISRIANVIPR
jgi:phospholipase/lecithinase/hemolysin